MADDVTTIDDVAVAVETGGGEVLVFEPRRLGAGVRARLATLAPPSGATVTTLVTPETPAAVEPLAADADCLDCGPDATLAATEAALAALGTNVVVEGNTIVDNGTTGIISIPTAEELAPTNGSTLDAVIQEALAEAATSPATDQLADVTVAVPEVGGSDPNATLAPIDPQNPGRFKATLVVEEEMTSDYRIISKGATSWRPTPLPLMLMTETAPGHDGAVIAAVMEKITRNGSAIVAEGRFDASENGVEAARLVRERVLTGVSIDGGEVEAEVITEEADDGSEFYVLRMTAITILGATIVPFPAIGSTNIEYMTAAAADPNHVMALSIEWLPPEDDAEPLAADALTAAAASLTAAGPRTFPEAYFADPQLRTLTPVQVSAPDADGNCRVFGHLAPWDSCHISFTGTCVTPPHSHTGYAHFMKGSVRTNEGGIQAVGTVALNASHAGPRALARDAQAHYDNTGSAAAWVTVGEDALGIWMAGVLRPGLSEQHATEFAAAGAVSGDWRTISGNLELVAVLAVNTPGFPVAGLRDGTQVSLVAAGYGVAKRTRQQFDARVEDVERQTAERFRLMEDELASLREAIELLTGTVRPIAHERARARLAALTAEPEVLEPAPE